MKDGSDTIGGGAAAGDHPDGAGGPVVRLQEVSYAYNPGTPLCRTALESVSVDVAAGRVTAVIGPTAAGKSTLLQIAAGLLKPTGGTRAGPGLRDIGMVFQRPEIQLFAATVNEDVAAGPSFHGLQGDELRVRVEGALRRVGLNPAAYGKRRPHQLSVGEQRRVALAGILSLEPRLLVLDEPGAGLDPAGREGIMRDVVAWAREEGAEGIPARTLLFTSHDLDEVAELADQVILLARGRCVTSGPAAIVLAEEGLLAENGLELPLAARIACRLGVTMTGEGGRAAVPVTAAGLEQALFRRGRPA
ncbi:MAG: energy-coupling factor transporter ATPase [Thermoleophilia bacterium]